MCKEQVRVLNNLFIHISEICFWFISLYSLLLFPTYLGVGMDSQPQGTCQGCDNNSLNPKKGTIVPVIAAALNSSPAAGGGFCWCTRSCSSRRLCDFRWG